MKFRHILTLAVSAATAFFCVSCGESIPKVSNSKEDFHIFLLMGDELMSGRAEIDNTPQLYDPHIVMLDKDGNWVPARFPIQYDSPDAKAGPGIWFARAYAEVYKTAKIGLVPCAFSGSLISEWQPGQVSKATGEKPFDVTVARAKKAMQDGTLKVAFWMQGLNERSGSGYQDKAEKLFDNLRSQLGMKNLPIVASQMIMRPLPKAQEDISSALRSLRDSQNLKGVPYGFVSNREIFPGADGKFMDAAGLISLDGRFLTQVLLVTGYQMFPEGK